MSQSNSRIKVAVHGSAGKVGQEVVRAVHNTENLSLVASIDRIVPEWLPLDVAHFNSFDKAIEDQYIEIVVDFTNAKATMDIIESAIAAGIHLVIGSTGFTEEQISALSLSMSNSKSSAILAPNFTIGAVLLAKLAKLAAPYFDYVDVSEEHHENKVDSPSGTAISIVKSVKEGHPEEFLHNVPERESIGQTRGGLYEGISIHSSRLPGRLAHHQVVFGSSGQTLTLRHDTINRECYMPGVLLAIQEVKNHNGLVVGLENLLNI